nr:hypothetical protein 4 [Campylobacterota bacterium]
MTRQEFTELLKEAKLSRKEFAAKLDMTYGTVNNWGNANQSVPTWVKSWLENYIKAKHFDNAKKIFCEDLN